MIPRHRITSLWLTLSLFGSGTAFAGDIDSDISRGQYTGNGGYFEIGSHLLAGNSPLIGTPKKGDTVKEGALSLTGRYQWGPGFVELESSSSEEASSQITAGLNLWNNQTWWFDAVVSQFHRGIEVEENASFTNSAVKDRKADVPVGLRATGYIGNTLVQITVLSGDLTGEHDGYVLSSEIGRNWQHRNVNYHMLIGAVLESDKVTQYYFGIDSVQADANFSEYHADASFRLFTELGLTYVLTEDWILRSTARYTKLSNEIEDSPIIEDDYASVAALSLSYVF